jgi:hypothetical protein
MTWAWLLRLRKTIGGSSVRVGWLASLPLAALNGALASALTFTFATPNDAPSIASTFEFGVAGATVGAIFWVPSLVLTLLLFGVPIAWSQKLARQGLAGEERGERLVAVVSVAIAIVALLMSREYALHQAELESGMAFGRAAAVAACIAGGVAAVLAQMREVRRRDFVARAEAGEVRGFRVDVREEGKVLMRVTSLGEGYRVADFHEEVCLLDEEGRARHRRA